jgi:hypothetical protein
MRKKRVKHNPTLNYAGRDGSFIFSRKDIEHEEFYRGP